MIHILGNSHVNTFSNWDSLSRIESSHKSFKLHHIGPVTARYGYDVHLNKINAVLVGIRRKKDYIIPMAGEVDCRMHIGLQADRRKMLDKEMVDIFMEGFMKWYDYMLGLRYRLISFGVHPSTTEDHDMSDIYRPIYGDMERRNKISRLWNKKLKEESKLRNIPYFDIFDYVVNENDKTNMEFYLDYCHLNSSLVIPYIEKELKAIGIKI
jgi:hypothetical protein